MNSLKRNSLLSDFEDTTVGQISIVGYKQDCKCEHCGRNLVHGIRISDGRIVGATCLDKKLTKAKVYGTKKYRLGAELIVRAAKVVQWKQPSEWSAYGVSPLTIQFEAA
jgi:hypothetical protein